MKKIGIFLLGLILSIAISIPAQAAGVELPVTVILGSANTAATAPVQYLRDNNPETVWQSSGSTNGPFWAELRLAGAALIDGLSISGSCHGNLNVEYWQDGSWRPFLAVRDFNGVTLSPGWNLLDLSYDRIVTDRLRLWLTAAQPTVLGGIGEIKVLGRNLPEPERLDPVAITTNKRTDADHAATNLFDHNTYTSWWIHTGFPYDVETVADLGESCTVSRIKIYGDATGSKHNSAFKVQYLSGANWLDIPELTNITLSQLPKSWRVFQLVTPVTARKLRVVLLDHKRTGGLREVEFWGKRNTLSGSKYLHAAQGPVALTVLDSANYCFNLSLPVKGVVNLHLTGTGVPATPLTWELNGRSMGELTVSSMVDGRGFYRQTIDPAFFWNGPNFIRVNGAGFTIDDCRMELAPDNEIFTANSALTDGWKLTASNSGEQIVDLGGLYHLDELVFSFVSSQPDIQLAVDQNGQWVDISSTPQSETGAVGGRLTYTVNTNARKIKVVSGTGSLSELTIHGSRVNEGAPRVRITAPLDGDCLGLLDWVKMDLTGTVDNPEAELRVNGKRFDLKGTNFSIPLPALGLKTNESKEITVTATDSAGRTGTATITISIGLPPNFTLNLPDEIIYTKEAQITVSGKVLIPSSKVWVNGAEVPVVSKHNFSTSVKLREGLNLITVKVSPLDNVKLSNIKQRYIVRTSGSPYLKVLYPAGGQITKEKTITVSGRVSSLVPVNVTVNGQTATVTNGFFASKPIALAEGNNPLTVVATDQNGGTGKAEVVVKLDSAAPELTEIQPGEGAYINKATVTVTGKVSDISPVTVLVNGVAAAVTNGEFKAVIPASEGLNTIKIEAGDAAGNMAQPVTRQVTGDTIAPAEFTPTVDPSGWTNNPAPTFTFATTDDGSGIASYAIKLNDGAWIAGVTSPYKFPQPITDGEHVVSVKAIDKAGNEREATVEVKIDTESPVAPTFMRVIPGNGRMVIKWSEDSPDVVEYRIERDLAFASLSVAASEKEYIDPNLENGATYKYRVKAIDRAGNESAFNGWGGAMVGLAVAEYVPNQGAVIEYDGVVLALPQTGVANDVAKIEITEIQSEYLEDKVNNLQIGPIYEFSAVKSDGTYFESISTDQGYLGKIQYDPAQVPQGFPEHNLDVYYYDTMFDRWFRIPSAGVDIENHTIYFITNHFSSFSVQATIVQDLSPQEYKDAGYSPLRSYAEYNGINVSPQGGTASTSVTELVLPGRNGFDFILKRRYDSVTSRADAFALAINGQMGFNFTNPAEGGTLLTAVEAGEKLTFWQQAGYQLADNIRNLIEQYLFNQGDYGYSMGQGWRLNLPYIKSANGSLMVVTPDGSVNSVSEMDLTTYVSTGVSNLGGTRILALRQNEGDNFTLTTFQVNANFDITGIFGCREDTILKTRWYSLYYTLKMKDGTTYEMDALGRTTKITDPAGENVITLKYNGLYLDYIKDSMGRIIHFEYTNVNNCLATRIGRIWVENDPYHREIKYNVGSNGLLDSAIDVGGRVSTYTYDYRVLYNGEIGFTINILEIIVKTICPIFNFIGPIFGSSDVVLFGHVQAQVVYPLKEMTAPGQGMVHINYDQPTITYGSTQVNFWWIIPVSVTFSLNLEQRLLANQVIVYESPGGPVERVSNFNYNIGFYSYGQPFIKTTEENDGKRRTVYNYTPVEKTRHRWDDSKGRIALDNNGLVETNPGEKLPSDCIVINFPVVFNSIDILPINTSTQIYDAQNGNLLELNTNEFDINTMRPTEQTTWRGDNYRRLNYSYDDWGNTVYIKDYSVSGTRVNQTETWMYYLPNTSCPVTGAPWLNSPFTQPTLEKDRHDLLVGKVVANYVPIYGGGENITYLHTYNEYNSIGQQTATAQWNGTKWLTTRFEYHPTFGSVTKKINPEGHETIYEYDSHGLPAAVTEKGVPDAQGNTVDIVTRTGYEYISGWKLWQQDPRGYVAEYRYDVLGRTTQITAPDDDDQAFWIPSGGSPSFRTNNPVTHIYYDDQDLLSIVTDPLGQQTKYDFDDLGQLVQLVKYHHENGQDAPVITDLEYDAWGNIIAITDPNRHTTRYQYDALGRNTAIEYPDEAGRKPTKYMNFNYSTNVLTITDENGKQAFEHQDMQGRTYRRDQYNEGMLIRTEKYFDGLGNEVITVDSKGSVAQKTYNQLNQLTRVDLPTEEFWENGTKTAITPYQRFEYSDAGYQIAEIHPLAGSNTEITNRMDVDVLGRVIRTKTPYTDGNVAKEAIVETYYDANGNKVKVVDANNTSLPFNQQKAATFTYSATNLVLEEVDQAGNKTSYTYDKAGNRTGMTDPRGNNGLYKGDFSIVYQYDDLNRLVVGKLPALPGQIMKPEVRLTYDKRGNLVKRVEPDGGMTTYTYTARNKVATETTSGNGVSYTVKHRYDKAGNEIETEDAKGNVVKKAYNDLNLVKTVTYPATQGRVEEHFHYDENGNKTGYINGKSVLTQYSYDKYNHLTQVIDGKNGITRYNFDRWGNMTQSINAAGHTTNYQYDELNRLLRETDPQGYEKSYKYDANGNRVESTDPNGTVSSYEYTPNNLVSKVTLQNGDTVKEIEYRYDEAGYRKWVKYDDVITEYNTFNNQYLPDPFGRIYKETKSFDGKVYKVEYNYDVMGRLTKITYPTGQAVDYQYNNLGQLQQAPGFVDETPVYDEGGWLKSLKAANGIVSNFSYDQNGRLTHLDYANQSEVLKQYNLGYDSANNIAQKNEDRFQYDALNQLLYANLKGNFEISLDEEVQKVGKTRNDFKGQKSFEFELTNLDVIELDYAAGSIGVDLMAPVKVNRIELQPNSPLHRVTKAGNIRLYSSMDNVTYARITGWKLVSKGKGKLEIVLDTPVTTRFLKVKSMLDDRDANFEPVNAAQFKNAPQDLIHVYYLMASRIEDYAYDSIGNRTNETITQRYPVSRTYTYYPNSSRLQSNGKYSFEYDNNGNLTKKETLIGEKIVWKYEYDLFNRLVKVTKNDSVVSEYLYDESGLRIKKTSPKTAIYYVFDTGGNVLYEQENREYMEYIYVLGKHFARVDGNLDNGISKKYFYHTDHLGSTVLVTDETGKQVWSAEYTPFGKQVSKEGEMDHVTKFTGKDLDEDTGLHYFNARWYDQETGRFITEDDIPIDPNDPFTLNLYLYCNNDPLNNTDPTGHENEETIPSIQPFQYQGNFNDVAITFDNAVIYAANDAISFANGLINEAKYIGNNGLGAYFQAGWEGIKSDTSNALNYIKDQWNYTTQTPIGQQVKDNINYISNPDNIANMGSAAIELFALRKLSPTAATETGISKTTAKVATAETAESKISYQTYTKVNKETGKVYSGRTSGTGTPLENVQNRDVKHHMNKKGYGPAKLDKSSTNKAAIRGREQQLIDGHGGAQSTGGTSGNRINGVSPKNPNLQHYMNEAVKEFGKWLGI